MNPLLFPTATQSPPIQGAGELRGIRIDCLRADLIHPRISGNKWYKLRANLAQAREEGRDSILSFGGPWSNHLHALAAAGRECGFRTLGIVRGELPDPLNPCLADARDWGMRLVPMSRADYRDKSAPHVVERLRREHGDFFLVPEGGANEAGLRGCAEMLAGVDLADYDLIALACGTGTTLAGLVSVSPLPVLGIQVLKGRGYLERAVREMLFQYGIAARAPWRILDDWHGGGYARVNPELLRFITDFEARTGIPLEPVYSGKVLMALHNLILRDFFPQNYSILVVHGGGLQGKRGFS